MSKLLFLGTGGSLGVPVVGCQCPVCLSSSPFNQRFRSSALLTVGEKKILIDAGPDFRAQALRFDLKRLDGVMLTHAHHDHIAGLDELRAYFLMSGKPLPCLLSEEVFEELSRCFPYIFVEKAKRGRLVSQFQPLFLPEDGGEVDFLGIRVHTMTYSQAEAQVHGLCFGNLAYLSDLEVYPDTIFEELKGIQTLVLSAFRFDPDTFEVRLDRAVEFAEKVGAEKTWLTHICHELDHEKTLKLLPPSIELAYDGLEISFEAGK